MIRTLPKARKKAGSKPKPVKDERKDEPLFDPRGIPARGHGCPSLEEQERRAR